MSSQLKVAQALTELQVNPEQFAAASVQGHCVVLAGPGSGKTKTLTTAMARTLSQDVVDPRGVACITYNNECAIELETRLGGLGIGGDDRSFIGTVHGFALAQVIAPYAHCVPGVLPNGFQVATRGQVRDAVEAAYTAVIDQGENPHERWQFAEEKRRRDVDRSRPDWLGRNPELAQFIEAYEARLREQGLIDFDDMPLIAYRMIKEHFWVREALRARFPVLFIDEYQDLGHALHELVLLLCFEGGIRLFAVGDVDQSIYSFTGANPALLQSLTERKDVETIRLRFNYRSGGRIIRASLGALGEDRDYQGVAGAPEGELTFWPVSLGHAHQAQHIVTDILPALNARGFALDQIAILYRAAWLGDKVAEALGGAAIEFVRTDGNALVKRSSRLSRFLEACARWVTGGWRSAEPPFDQLRREALSLVFGGRATLDEEQVVTSSLISFLRSGLGCDETTNAWLRRFDNELIGTWRGFARNPHQEWGVCAEMARQTNPAEGRDIPLTLFSGNVGGSGRVTLSTLHSAKGREFEAVILFGINDGDLPSWRDRKSDRALHEARRLFYVGVTRPRRELCLVYQEHHHSPWVAELYQRAK